MTKLVLSSDGRTLTVHIPMHFRRRGGRKEIVPPADHLPDTPPTANGEKVANDSPILTLGLARAWGRRIDAGESPEDIARREKRSASYVHRVVRLNLLAPDIVTAIVTGAWLPKAALTRLNTVPADWEEQRELLGFG